MQCTQFEEILAQQPDGPLSADAAIPRGRGRLPMPALRGYWGVKVRSLPRLARRGLKDVAAPRLGATALA